jgi:hypothetical protein
MYGVLDWIRNIATVVYFKSLKNHNNVVYCNHICTAVADRLL